jgi:hypothetical protein
MAETLRSIFRAGAPPCHFTSGGLMPELMLGLFVHYCCQIKNLCSSDATSATSENGGEGMRRKRREDGAFHAPKAAAPGSAEREEQERRWKEAVREAKQASFEIFEDRGPGVSVPPAGLARRDHRGRR